MNSRGLAARWPVILGGAALTRPYVEQDLAEVYEGEVRYARDAFEGLRLMDAARRGEARGAGRRAAGAAAAPGPDQRAARHRAARGHPGALRRRDRQPGARAAVLGQPHRQGHPAQGVRLTARRAGHLHGPVGTEGLARRRGPVLRGARRDGGPAAAADVAGAAARRADARGGGGLRLLPRGERGRRPGAARGAVGRLPRALPLHLPAPALRAASSASPTSSGRASPARPTCWGCSS